MRDPAPWQKRYELMFILALLFGLVSQYLLVGAPVGISALLLVACFYALFFYSVQGRIGGFDKFRGQLSSGWLLFIPIFLLTLTYVLFANQLLLTLNFFAIFALIIAQTVLLTKSSVLPWYRGAFYFELLFLSLIKPLTHIIVPFTLLQDRLKATRGEKTSIGNGNLGKIILGLVLAFPILLVVISLLASADYIFLAWINKIPLLFDQISLGDGGIRLFVGLFFAWYAFCYIWGLLFRKSSDQAAKAQMADSSEASLTSIRAQIDPITANTLLISINIVYVLFVLIQFTYLFGAAGGLLPEGTAYAEYARRGFAELIFVALINISLLMAGLHLIKQTTILADRLRKASLTILISCTIVMLASAFSRLSLYEEAYGFTELRLLVHGFMIYLGVLLVVALVRIWKERFSMGKVYICITIIAFVLINYINIDARVAARNIDRFEQSGIIDIQYLGTLSSDAAPELIKLQTKHPELAGLDEIIDDLRDGARSRNKWQSWNWSQARDQIAKKQRSGADETADPDAAFLFTFCYSNKSVTAPWLLTKLVLRT